MDEDPTLWLHLTLVTSLKAPPPNIVTLEVKASTQGFGEATAQSLTGCYAGQTFYTTNNAPGMQQVLTLKVPNYCEWPLPPGSILCSKTKLKYYGCYRIYSSHIFMTLFFTLFKLACTYFFVYVSLCVCMRVYVCVFPHSPVRGQSPEQCSHVFRSLPHE